MPTFTMKVFRGGPTGGHTGPDLFPYAVEAFRTILKDCGGKEG